MANVKIIVIGGIYEGASYEGPLADAPVTVLVPEGIVSARTTEEAERMRAVIARSLSGNAAVEIGAPEWRIRAELEHFSL